MPLHVSSTVVLIIRRSKLYYTAAGIITLKEVCGLKLIIIIIIIFMNCNWVVTKWQWLFYMYTKYEIG